MEAKNANPPFVQSTHKAVRACKLFLLHHRRIGWAMEVHVNSLQSLPRNISCTNADYILARSCRNGEAKNANPPFVQSTHKAVRAGGTICKLVPLCALVAQTEVLRLVSPFPQLLAHLWFALVQQLFRGRVCREFTRISIDDPMLRR